MRHRRARSLAKLYPCHVGAENARPQATASQAPKRFSPQDDKPGARKDDPECGLRQIAAGRQRKLAHDGGYSGLPRFSRLIKRQVVATAITIPRAANPRPGATLSNPTVPP